jgi:hypothetical protein
VDAVIVVVLCLAWALAGGLAVARWLTQGPDE